PMLFIPLDTLPLNSNGKLDRRALPPAYSYRDRSPDSYVAPRTDLEKRLVAIWEDELGVAPIGVTDDFFELGGDSLSATGLMAHLHRVFDRSLPPSALAEGATIAHLAKLLDRGTTHE